MNNTDAQTGYHFIHDLAERIEGRFQLTTDAFRPYAEIVSAVFGKEIDYGQLVKIYATTQGGGRYSPAECIGARAKKVIGNPDEKHISTSLPRGTTSTYGCTRGA